MDILEKKEAKFMEKLETTRQIDRLLTGLNEGLNEGWVAIADFRFARPELSYSFSPNGYNIRPADVLVQEADSKGEFPRFELAENEAHEHFLFDDDDDEEDEKQGKDQKAQEGEPLEKMFGFSSSTQALRKIRQHFRKTLENAIELINLINKIKNDKQHNMKNQKQ